MGGNLVSIPATFLYDLQRVPHDLPVAVLMRHSVRHPIIDPDNPFLARLTEEGVRLAEELGVIVGMQFLPGRVLSSPVERCIDTASAIARGAGWDAQVQSEERLSHPFIEPAWELVSRGEVNGRLPFQVRATLSLLLESTANPALDIAVTHDTIVGAVVGSLLKEPVMGEFWPGYLEGVFIWREGTWIHVRWRGKAQSFHITI